MANNPNTVPSRINDPQTIGTRLMINRNLKLILFLILLSACSGEKAYILGPQTHEDVDVLVEIRPGAPRVGMNEFIVVATKKNRIPAKDYIVSVKMKGLGEWRQSIQDGHSGVYRRAVRVNDPQTDVLLVELDDRKQKTVLSFPLVPK
ncbi:MAG: hypothetical protein OEZ68_16800 [Gammaproteobacteria bacterium]|nr:hypothetical protein [Gammaproteobacteria bacterium]MDH5802463.1 hypothetical protein [Gammaproteobacteria bacterium]